jgi:hypothetical protein
LLKYFDADIFSFYNRFRTKTLACFQQNSPSRILFEESVLQAPALPAIVAPSKIAICWAPSSAVPGHFKRHGEENRGTPDRGHVDRRPDGAKTISADQTEEEQHKIGYGILRAGGEWKTGNGSFSGAEVIGASQE